MTIYDNISKIPFGAILNARITLLIAEKLLNIAVAYVKENYLTIKDSVVIDDQHKGSVHDRESSNHVAGECHAQNHNCEGV